MRRLAIRVAAALTGAAALVLTSTARAEDRRSAAAADAGLVELGRRLFFDPAASRLGRHACADCHKPDHAFSDPRVTSDDDFGPTERHSQTLVDVGLTASAHWDGQFTHVSDLTRSRLGVGRRGGYGDTAALMRAALAK